jgi:hypothetical protein
MKPTGKRQHFARLTGAVVATLVTLAIQRQSAQGPQPSSEAPPSRLALTSMPASPALQQAVSRFRQTDPSASFTWLRGHVDAFTAWPRPSVPAYARTILQQHGLSTDGVAPIKETTTSLPNDSHNDPNEPVEELAGTNVGFDGPNDPAPKRDAKPVEAAASKMARPTTWYEQTGEEVVRDVLTAFLTKNRDVFEVPSDLLEQRLPNLTLIRYGVGKQGRRAQFEQNVNGVPLLNGKTVIWFDLNWNVIAISRQLVTDQKLGIASAAATSQETAVATASNAIRGRFGKASAPLHVADSQLGIDVIRAVRAWQVDVVDTKTRERYRATLDAADNRVLNLSDDTARYTDAKVSRWRYTDGDMTQAVATIDSNIYTHDDNTLVHDFFYIVNDDRNDGGTGTCTSTPRNSSTTPNAYGTTTSAEYVRPTRRGDRDFSLWEPNDPKGSFGEAHVYYWAREYLLWQKQALVDEGVLTLGDFDNYTKVLIIVNACDDDSGHFDRNLLVSTLDDEGEGLSAIVLPDRCRAGSVQVGDGNDCVSTDYEDSDSGNLYTFQGDGGYHFPGVIDHELNHFVLIKYFDVTNTVNCGAHNETKYFQEGGLGRTLPQMFWHHYYGVGYMPDWTGGANFTTNKLFRSNDVSGRPHNADNAASLNAIASYACGADNGNPYAWGGVVAQPMWEIYQGQKVDGAVLTPIERPASDTEMIRSMYYAADMASASSAPERFELANRFMEWWELFGAISSTVKSDWCDVWAHHGMNTFINVNYCS